LSRFDWGCVLGGGFVEGAGCRYMIGINPPCNGELLRSICEELKLYVIGFGSPQLGVCGSKTSSDYNDVCSNSGGEIVHHKLIVMR